MIAPDNSHECRIAVTGQWAHIGIEPESRLAQNLISSKNLTEAAHKAGFVDSAHFSRTFLRMFGVPPSEILKNSQIILCGKDAAQTDKLHFHKYATVRTGISNNEQPL